jgi:MerR family transcriptional regulator/heat shock protein HspR
MTDIKIKSDLPVFPISTAAKLLNVSVHTLRMYEREGLFISYKKNSNRRLFSKSDLERIECIRRSINELKISINGIKAIYSLVPCWRILKCKKENRENCGAFNGHDKPCWSYVNKNCRKQECRNCGVYNNYSDCEKIKGLLKSYSS